MSHRGSLPSPEPSLSQEEVVRLECSGVRILPAARLGTCGRCGAAVRYGDGAFAGFGPAHRVCRAEDLSRIAAGRRRAARFGATLRARGVEVPRLREDAEHRQLLCYLIVLGRAAGASPALDLYCRALALRWCATALRRLRADPAR